MSLFFLTHTFICAHKLFFFAVNKIIFVNVCVLRSPPCTHVYRRVLRDCTHVYRGLPRLYTCVQGVQHTHTHTHTHKLPASNVSLKRKSQPRLFCFISAWNQENAIDRWNQILQFLENRSLKHFQYYVISRDSTLTNKENVPESFQ